MKKYFSIVLAIAMLVSSMILPASAVGPNISEKSEIIHTEYGNIELIDTLIVHDSSLRSSTKSADRIRTVKFGGVQIAEVTLSATFGYDGKTAWVVSTDSSHSTSGGWLYRSEKISDSGSTAKLTATLTHILDGDIPVSISMSCSPSGQIS